MAGSLAAVLLVGACSGSDAEGPQVASVGGAQNEKNEPNERTGQASAKTAKSADREIPIGATEEEADRLYDAYFACWTKGGIPDTQQKDGTNGGPLLTFKFHPENKKYQKVVDDCAYLEPIYVAELDPDRNPDYYDQLRDELACMKDKGYPMEIRDGQPGLWVSPATEANFERMATDKATEDSRQCEIEAYQK